MQKLDTAIPKGHGHVTGSDDDDDVKVRDEGSEVRDLLIGGFFYQEKGLLLQELLLQDLQLPLLLLQLPADVLLPHPQPERGGEKKREKEAESKAKKEEQEKPLCCNQPNQPAD